MAKFGSNGNELSPSEISRHLARQGERGGGKCGAYQVDVGSAPPPTGHYADADLPSAKKMGRPDETGN